MTTLIEAGLNLDPVEHSFTYTFPPARIARRESNAPHLLTSEMPSWPDYSLYLHIPFCRMTCRFCSLHRVVATSDDRVERYRRALAREIELLRPVITGKQCHSVYVGGGTPTILEPSLLAELLAVATEEVDSSSEISIECAPDETRSVADWDNYFARLAALRPRVTRVSIGVESTDVEVLEHMGRRGGLEAMLAVAIAADRWFETYNVDFLIGYPDGRYTGERDTANIIDGITLLRARGLRLPAISLYEMWDVGYVPATRRANAARPCAQDIWETKQRLQDWLFGLGYSPSPGCTFISDPAYAHRWTMHRCFDFRHVGLGSGSYSFTPQGFSQRDREISRYLEAVESSESYAELDEALGIGYKLTEEEVELRRVILGLRSADWVTSPESSSPGSLLAELEEKLRTMIAAGVIDEHCGQIRLAKEAFIWSNEVSAALHPAAMSRTWRP